jgi:hypothetical protein
LLTTHMESGSTIPKRMKGHVGNRVGIVGDQMSNDYFTLQGAWNADDQNCVIRVA